MSISNARVDDYGGEMERVLEASAARASCEPRGQKSMMNASWWRLNGEILWSVFAAITIIIRKHFVMITMVGLLVNHKNRNNCLVECRINNIPQCYIYPYIF